MPMFQKHFTLEEARSRIPEIRAQFARIHELYEQTERLRADFLTVQKRIQQNGHAPKVSGFEEHVEKLNALIKEVIDTGIEIKDVVRGLIDFPAWHNGNEVFLCFELSDMDILFWHKIEEGYVGRIPIRDGEFVL